jgi:hypothetical protein
LLKTWLKVFFKLDGKRRCVSRWLDCELYTLYEYRGSSGVRYQWENDAGTEIGPCYSAIEMAEVHFGGSGFRADRKN